jgi:ABC-type transporter Mla subunit MlaD
MSFPYPGPSLHEEVVLDLVLAAEENLALRYIVKSINRLESNMADLTQAFTQALVDLKTRLDQDATDKAAITAALQNANTLVSQLQDQVKTLTDTNTTDEAEVTAAKAQVADLANQIEQVLGNVTVPPPVSIPPAAAVTGPNTDGTVAVPPDASVPTDGTSFSTAPIDAGPGATVEDGTVAAEPAPVEDPAATDTGAAPVSGTTETTTTDAPPADAPVDSTPAADAPAAPGDTTTPAPADSTPADSAPVEAAPVDGTASTDATATPPATA